MRKEMCGRHIVLGTEGYNKYILYQLWSRIRQMEQCRRNRVTTLQYIKSFGHKSDVLFLLAAFVDDNPQLDWQHCNQLTDTIKRFIVETTNSN